MGGKDHFNIMKPNQILLFLRGSEQVSPKCATLACGLFLAEGK